MTTSPAMGPSELVTLADDQRDVAMHRWTVLRPHLENGVPLVAGPLAAVARTATLRPPSPMSSAGPSTTCLLLAELL